MIHNLIENHTGVGVEGAVANRKQEEAEQQLFHRNQNVNRNRIFEPKAQGPFAGLKRPGASWNGPNATER
jgi:hypothetical protein